MLNQAENVSPRQEVVQAVRKKLSGQMEQYYYAVQNGYSVTEEELKMCMDEQDKIIDRSIDQFSYPYNCNKYVCCSVYRKKAVTLPAAFLHS